MSAIGPTLDPLAQPSAPSPHRSASPSTLDAPKGSASRLVPVAPPPSGGGQRQVVYHTQHDGTTFVPINTSQPPDTTATAATTTHSNVRIVEDPDAYRPATPILNWEGPARSTKPPKMQLWLIITALYGVQNVVTAIVPQYIGSDNGRTFLSVWIAVTCLGMAVLSYMSTTRHLHHLVVLLESINTPRDMDLVVENLQKGRFSRFEETWKIQVHIIFLFCRLLRHHHGVKAAPHRLIQRRHSEHHSLTSGESLPVSVEHIALDEVELDSGNCNGHRLLRDESVAQRGDNGQGAVRSNDDGDVAAASGRSPRSVQPTLRRRKSHASFRTTERAANDSSAPRENERGSSGDLDINSMYSCRSDDDDDDDDGGVDEEGMSSKSDINSPRPNVASSPLTKEGSTIVFGTPASLHKSGKEFGSGSFGAADIPHGSVRNLNGSYRGAAPPPLGAPGSHHHGSAVLARLRNADPLDDNSKDWSEVLAVAGHSDSESRSIFVSLLRQISPGQDLSKVVLPVHILEPRSLLEKLSDLFVHGDLFGSVAKSGASPVERMVAIVRWYISGYHIRPVGARKPYNPVLGETFECIFGEDTNDELYYFAEQVSHHPPITAFRAVHKRTGVELAANYVPRSKLVSPNCGASMGEGCVEVYVPAYDEVYCFNWPSAYVSGLLSPPLRLELVGDVRIQCSSSTIAAKLSFQRKGWFDSQYDVLTGEIVDTAISSKNNGHVLYTISGKWNAQTLLHRHVAGGKSTVDSLLLDPERLVPSRPAARPTVFRKPSRAVWASVTLALRAGDAVAAQSRKSEIEGREREERRSREARDEVYVPGHFRIVGEHRGAGKDVWRYVPPTVAGVTWNESTAPGVAASHGYRAPALLTAFLARKPPAALLK